MTKAEELKPSGTDDNNDISGRILSHKKWPRGLHLCNHGRTNIHIQMLIVEGVARISVPGGGGGGGDAGCRRHWSPKDKPYWPSVQNCFPRKF